MRSTAKVRRQRRMCHNNYGDTNYNVDNHHNDDERLQVSHLRDEISMMIVFDITWMLKYINFVRGLIIFFNFKFNI